MSQESQQGALNFDQRKSFFRKLQAIEFDYSLLTNLPTIFVACFFSPSSFKLKIGKIVILT